jgi:hypothetical protein
MAAVSSSNDAIRGGPCSRSPDRIVNTYSGNCGSFRPRVLTLQRLPPKSLSLRSASRSEVCPPPSNLPPKRVGTARRLGRNCSGTMRQALDRSVPQQRILATGKIAQRLSAPRRGAPQNRAGTEPMRRAAPSLRHQVLKNTTLCCIFTGCAARAKPSQAVCKRRPGRHVAKKREQ